MCSEQRRNPPRTVGTSQRGPHRALKGVDAKLTAEAAKALNEAFNTDLFAGGLLIGEATVIAKIGAGDNGDDHDDNDDKGEDKNDD